MDEQSIHQKLDRLAELKSQADAISLHYADIRATIVPAEILQALADLDAEKATALEELSGGIASLEDEIKANVLANGATVKGAYLMAVYAKGRVSWDQKLLDGFALAHPEIAAARKVGDPSVSFRTVK
jgi:hypothetical protein